jgi:hypothetical protein
VQELVAVHGFADIVVIRRLRHIRRGGRITAAADGQDEKNGAEESHFHDGLPKLIINEVTARFRQYQLVIMM